MKTRFNPFLRSAALTASIILCLGHEASAGILTWDGSDATTSGAQGGNGIWDTSLLNWWDGAADVVWPSSGIDNDAVFAATAGTVTLGSAITANDLTFNTTGYILSGAQTLTLNGTTPTITTATGVTATIASTVDGTVGLVKAGAGTLKLSGANIYTGGTTLTLGTLQIGGSNVGSVGSITSSAIGTGALTFNGGTLSSDGTTARTILNAVTFTGNATLGNATNNGKLTFSAGLNLGGTARTLTLNSDVQLDAAFSNPAAASAIIKTGTGTLTINASNAGVSMGTGNGFTISAGKVIAANTAAFGNANQIVSLNGGTGTAAGSTLEFATDATPNSYVLNIGSTNNGTVILNRANSSTAGTYSMGVATLGQSVIFNVQKGGNVTDTPTLTLAGLTLSAGSTGTTTLNPISANISITGNVTGGNTAAAKTLQLGGTSVGNTIGGNISNGTANPLAITKANTGTWTLSGTSNTYTGGTNVNAGTLLLSGAGNMPTTGTLTVAAGGNFSLADGTVRTATTTAALSLASGAGLTFDWSSAGTVDKLTSTASATTVAGPVGISINKIGTPTGTGLTLLSSGAGLNTATYYLANNTDFTATLGQSATAVTIGSYNTAGVTALNTGDAYWKGGQLSGAGVGAMALSSGTSSNWATDAAGTLSGGTVPGGSAVNVIFGATGATGQSTVTTAGADMNLGSITFNDAAAVTIGGSHAITLNSTSGTAASTTAASAAVTAGSALSVTQYANATNTISANLVLGAGQTWNVANGKTLAVSGVVSGNSEVS